MRSNNTNPKYGKPGDKIQLAGKFYTKDWGNLNMDERGTVKVLNIILVNKSWTLAVGLLSNMVIMDLSLQ